MVKAKELIGDKGVIFENMVSNLDNSSLFSSRLFVSLLSTFITIMVTSLMYM